MRWAMIFSGVLIGFPRGTLCLFEVIHRPLKLFKPLLRRKPQTSDEKREVDAEVARGGDGAARSRVEQSFFGGAAHG